MSVPLSLWGFSPRSPIWGSRLPRASAGLAWQVADGLSLPSHWTVGGKMVVCLTSALDGPVALGDFVNWFNVDRSTLSYHPSIPSLKSSPIFQLLMKINGK